MDLEALTLIDYTVITVVVLSTIFAFFRGFVGSFLSLVGWILSIYLAYALYPTVQPFLQARVKNEIFAGVLGHSALLLGFLIIFGIFNLFVTSALKTLSKGMIDRSLGAGFGVLRGGIIVSFFFFVAVSTIQIFNGGSDSDKDKDKTIPKWITDSQTYPMLQTGKTLLAEFIPDSFNQRMAEFHDKMSKKITDENLGQNIAEQLQKHLTPERSSELTQDTAEDQLTMSADEAEANKLKKLIKLYREQTAESGNTLVDEKELKKLEDRLSTPLSPDEPAATE